MNSDIKVVEDICHLAYGIGKLTRSEKRILWLLSQNEKGLCHNDLEKEGGPDHKTIHRRMPNLMRRKNSLVEMKKQRGKRGQMENVYFLTLEGKKCVKIIQHLEQIDKKLKRFFELSKEDERLKTFSDVMGNLYKIYVKAFHSRGDVEAYRRFFDAVTKPMRDIRNERLFDPETKKAILEGKRLGMKYYDAHFGLEKMSIGFILEDSKLALELGHYLNRHHMYVLSKFDIEKEENLEKKNKKWLKTKGSLDFDKVKKEIEIRKKEIRDKFPKFAIPKDYGDFLGDVR